MSELLDVLTSNSETGMHLLRRERESELSKDSASRQEPYETIEDSLLGEFRKS